MEIDIKLVLYASNQTCILSIIDENSRINIQLRTPNAPKPSIKWGRDGFGLAIYHSIQNYSPPETLKSTRAQYSTLPWGLLIRMIASPTDRRVYTDDPLYNKVPANSMKQLSCKANSFSLVFI